LLFSFVGAAKSPAAPYKCPTYTVQQPSSFTLGHTLLPKKKVGRLWAPQNCSTKGEGFDLKYFGGEVVEGKKMLFQAYI
jgi:hypothetical protein